MLAAQGAELEAFGRKLELDHTAPIIVELKAQRAGWVTRCDARVIGEIIRDLGGGRTTKESVINYDAGVDRLVKPGEAVQSGALLARVHAAESTAAVAALRRLKSAFVISNRRPRPAALVGATIASRVPRPKI